MTSLDLKKKKILNLIWISGLVTTTSSPWRSPPLTPPSLPPPTPTSFHQRESALTHIWSELSRAALRLTVNAPWPWQKVWALILGTPVLERSTFWQYLVRIVKKLKTPLLPDIQCVSAGPWRDMSTPQRLSDCFQPAGLCWKLIFFFFFLPLLQMSRCEHFCNSWQRWCWLP